jgi:hypothetical protein
MSGTILVVYDTEPPFPATSQHPSATRTSVISGPNTYIVDAIGGEPTESEVLAFINPPAKARIATFESETDQATLATHLRNDTPAQVDAYVTATPNTDLLKALVKMMVAQQIVK